MKKTVHCGETPRFSEVQQTKRYLLLNFPKYITESNSYLSRNIQLQVTFGLLNLVKSGSFRHSLVI
jgi:hypothetical protein